MDFYHANQFLALDDRELLPTIQEHLAGCLPAFASAHIQNYGLVRLPQAVTHFAPGCYRHLLPAKTSFNNLWMSGDWIVNQHGSWSQEKAYVTGLEAANQVIAQWQIGVPAAVIPVEPDEPHIQVARSLISFTTKPLVRCGPDLPCSCQIPRIPTMPLLRFYTEGLDHPALAHIPLIPLIHGLFRGLEPEAPDFSPWHYRFNDYWQVSSHYFTLSADLASCDFVVLPYDWYWVRGPHWRRSYADPTVAHQVTQISQGLYEKARAANKPVVLFFGGDRSHEAVPFPKAIILREGLYQSRRQAQEFVCPAFAEDLLQQVSQGDSSLEPGQVVLRPKTDRPTVGFCGLAKPVTLKKRAKDLYYHGSMLVTQGHWDVSPHLGEKLRIQAIKRLKFSPDLQTNFIVRSESVFLGANPDQKTVFRQDYIQNLLNSDYILCCRGSGNYSFRLYETLSMGRIPLFLNTDSGFPYDFLQDWKQYCIWVEPQDLKSLPEKVLAFHNTLSAQDFIELQQRCRQFWLEWLSVQGFFSQFHHHLSHLGLIPAPTPES